MQLLSQVEPERNLISEKIERPNMPKRFLSTDEYFHAWMMHFHKLAMGGGDIPNPFEENRQARKPLIQSWTKKAYSTAPHANGQDFMLISERCAALFSEKQIDKESLAKEFEVIFGSLKSSSSRNGQENEKSRLADCRKFLDQCTLFFSRELKWSEIILRKEANIQVEQGSV